MEINSNDKVIIILALLIQFNYFFLAAIVTSYENNTQHDPNTNNAMLGVHASASAIIQYGKIARKQGLVNVALDILSRIHTIPTVPIVDCFQKIRQQVKCYLQLAGVMGKNECMQVSEL